MNKDQLVELDKIMNGYSVDYRIDITKQYWIMEARAIHLGINIKEIRVAEFKHDEETLVVVVDGDKGHIAALDMRLVNVQESNKFKHKLKLEVYNA